MAQDEETTPLQESAQDSGEKLEKFDKEQQKNIRKERNKLETAFIKEFKAILDNGPASVGVRSTVENETKWKELLQDDRWEKLEQLVEKTMFNGTQNTIPEPKTFLRDARLQPVLAQMLEDIAKYRPYLDLFIERFKAENECIVQYLYPEDRKNKPTAKFDTPKLNAPIHFAVIQLDEDFLEWLLKRPGVDVNLRNHCKQTALALLCSKYDQGMQPKQMDRSDEQLQNNANSTTQLTAEELPKLRNCITQLVNAGADFNICSTHMKLPFELLLKHCEAHDETRDLVARCVQDIPYALAICSINDRNERLVGFYNNNPNVQVTVELLEIFLRYSDRSNFTTHMAKFEISPANVKKVIRLLLHTACDQKLSDCAKLILNLLFYTKDASTERVKSNTHGKLKISDLRAELKGLLKKVCLNADLPLLKLLISKIYDPALLNDDPLLVVTLSQAYHAKRLEEYRQKLIACAEFLATQEVIRVTKRDSSGNTALHLALKYGYDSVAFAILRQKNSYLGMRNKDNLTPLDYGTYGFWKAYFDRCIEVDKQRSVTVRKVIRFNLQGFNIAGHDMRIEKVKVKQLNENYDAKAVTSIAEKEPKPPAASEKRKSWRNSFVSWFRGWKMVERPSEKVTAPRKYMRTVTEMTALRQISESKNLEQLLLHPVLYTFIMVKWTRLCYWNYLNLLITALTIVFFGLFSLYASNAEDSNMWPWLVLSTLGMFYVLLRELVQGLFLRRSYVTFENLTELITALLIGVALCIAPCGLLSSFIIVSFAMQLIFLLGSLQWENISTMMYMFQTVSKNFLTSFSLFIPLLGAFIFAFYLTYNEKPEDNFNNFNTLGNATIKILVMMTGEFEAASINFNGGKIWLFVAFVFLAPIVLLNLINGLAVSDIAKIREESELIGIRNKVVRLEQYERGAATIWPVWLRRHFPKPFFEEYEGRIHTKTMEHRKIEVHVRELSEKHECTDINAQHVIQIQSHRKSKVKKEQPLPKFASFLKGESCDRIINLRIYQFPLFSQASQTAIDEALTIIEQRQENTTV